MGEDILLFFLFLHLAVVFTCPLSCSENLEVIVSVCDSLVRRCGRVVTIIIVIVYDSLVRHCGKVLANVIVIV